MGIDTNVQLLDRRRTKIVATLGPASSDPKILEALIRGGANVLRLNFSHGDHEGHRDLFRKIRAAEARVGCSVGVLGDLSGPKIRTGLFEGGAVTLEAGQEVLVTTLDAMGKPGLIPSQYEALARDVTSGDRILLDDGNLELEVIEAEDPNVRCRVVHGGVLEDRKGMNLPGVNVSAPSLSEKDRSDARFALELGVDFLALSFVRRAADVRELRTIMEEVAHPPLLVAKIEKPEALLEIEEILDAADALMVARGDLGVELRPEKVPLVQGQLVELALSREKPVIVATQMMDSMIRCPRPTRAEVMDVSQAVRAGSDAVMLSGETASGDFPVQAVEMMDRVIRETEAYLWKTKAFGGFPQQEWGKPPPLAWKTQWEEPRPSFPGT